MTKSIKKILLVAVLACSALVAGCSSNIGIGLDVGIPIGDHGYMSVGTGGRWH
jgi:predicted small secreted protein